MLRGATLARLGTRKTGEAVATPMERATQAAENFILANECLEKRLGRSGLDWPAVFKESY